MIKKIFGFLLVTLAAFAFMTVFETVEYMFAADQFMFVTFTGRWSTPYQALGSALHIMAIVGVACFAMIEYHPEMRQKNGEWKPFKVPFWFRFLFGMFLFSFLQYWSQPIVRLIADAHVETITERFGDYWYNFAVSPRELLFAYIAASPIMVSAELFRQKMNTTDLGVAKRLREVGKDLDANIGNRAERDSPEEPMGLVELEPEDVHIR